MCCVANSKSPLRRLLLHQLFSLIFVLLAMSQNEIFSLLHRDRASAFNFVVATLSYGLVYCLLVCLFRCYICIYTEPFYRTILLLIMKALSLQHILSEYPMLTLHSPGELVW